MRLRLPLSPIAKGRGRLDPRRLRIYTPEKTRSYMDRIKQEVLMSLGSDVILPVFSRDAILRVDVDFVFPRLRKHKGRKYSDGLIWKATKPDRDNLDKAVLDALKGVLWYDDASIVDGRIRKFFAERNGDPRICLRVEEVGDVPMSLCDYWGSDIWEELDGEESS